MTTITIPHTDLDCLRDILRETIGTYAEQLGEVATGLAGDVPEAEARIAVCERIAAQLGGPVTDDELSTWLTDGSERL